MTTPKRRGRAVSAGREYRAGGSAASGQTPHNCPWISNVLSPPDHLAPLIARGAFSTGSLRHADSPLEGGGLNFQYAGTGESRHSSFVLPDCLGRVSACPGAAGFL
jgi:hypothetical protein